MGRIEDIERKLYQPESRDLLERRGQSRIALPRPTAETPRSWQDKENQQPSGRGTGWFRSQKFMKAVIATLLGAVAAGAALFFLLYAATRGQEAEVVIDSRRFVESGEVVTIPVLVKNVSGSALREVEAVLVLPSGSLVRAGVVDAPAPPRMTRKIEDIEPGEERTAEFTVRLFGRQGEEKIIEAAVLYRPDRLRARFVARASQAIAVRSVPLALSWDLPETLRRGQEVEARVHFVSHAELPFDSVWLKIDYPAGFAFGSADPKPAVGETLWNVGLIEPGQTGFITFRGTIQGEERERKTFGAGLGLFSPETKEWRPYVDASRDAEIASVPLLIETFINDARSSVIQPGDPLIVLIRYRNRTSETLKNIRISSRLEGSILDFASIQADKGGVFDAEKRAVVWGPGATAELQELKSDQGGEVRIRVQTRLTPPVRDAGDRNLAVQVRTSIEPLTIPEAFAGTDLAFEDALEFKVATKVLFSGRTLQRSSPIPSIGPLPPRVGEKTTYTIVWDVRNFTNDLLDVEVRAGLPPNVRWEGAAFPQEESLLFLPAASEVRWSVKRVAAGTGILTPAKSVAFQVSVIPAESDAGGRISLIHSSELRATDAFTAREIRQSISSLTTELPEDAGANPNEWRVVR